MAVATTQAGTTIPSASLPDGTSQWPLQVGLGLPAGASEVGASSGNVANASAVAALPAVVGKTNYLTGLQFTFTGSTLGSVVVATVTGLLIGTLTFIIAAPAGVLAIGQSIILSFDLPRAASAPNTAITFTCPALGAGSTNACANIQGFVV